MKHCCFIGRFISAEDFILKDGGRRLDYEVAKGRKQSPSEPRRLKTQDRYLVGPGAESNIYLQCETLEN
ncbi:MAG: hypothetical protein RLQ12_13130 [Cyclobacteriaceae bacterium]